MSHFITQNVIITGGYGGIRVILKLFNTTYYIFNLIKNKFKKSPIVTIIYIKISIKLGSFWAVCLFWEYLYNCFHFFLGMFSEFIIFLIFLV